MDFKKNTITLSFFALMLYGGLFLSLFYFFDATNFFETLFSKRVAFSVVLSLKAALFASVLAMILALPSGYALSRYSYPFKNIIDTILEFPIIVSPAALGAVVLIFFNTPLGEWIQNNTQNFIFTFYGIVLAQFITVYGIAVRFVKNGFDMIESEIEQTAHILGASETYTFFKISVPQAKKAILSAFILSFAKALGEFGATITVAGTMAYKTETLPVSIYMHLEVADIKTTVALIIILVFIGLASLFLARMLNNASFR